MRVCKGCGVEFELRPEARAQLYCMYCQDERLHSPDIGFRRYGITRADYNARLLAQGGRCAICRREPEPSRRLAIDHDHATGAVRGLLCGGCNILLGTYERLDPDWPALANRYLSRKQKRTGSA